MTPTAFPEERAAMVYMQEEVETIKIILKRLIRIVTAKELSSSEDTLVSKDYDRYSFPLELTGCLDTLATALGDRLTVDDPAASQDASPPATSDKSPSTAWYCVIRGRKVGVVQGWAATSALTNGFKGCIQFKCKDYDDAVSTFLGLWQSGRVSSDDGTFLNVEIPFGMTKEEDDEEEE